MWSGSDAPYQELPALPPAREVETKLVLKKLVGAVEWLAAVNTACRLILDPSVLINTIPLLEAQASSEIENIVTTNDELFRAANDAAMNPSPATKEALRYRRALHWGFDQIARRPLSFATAEGVCSVINGFEMGIRAGVGTYIGNPVTGERIYTPPEGRDVIRAHVDGWEAFIHAESDLHPLVRMALLHYQFEAIHPFVDGNGRTGRILNLLHLIESKILDLPVIYLSGYILKNKGSYYRLLGGVTARGEWEPWICFMLDAVAVTAKWTYELISRITDQKGLAEKDVDRILPYGPSHALVELLFTQPYVRVENIVEANLAQRQTAAKWLNELAADGILEKRKIGRSNVYVNQGFVHLLFGPSALTAMTYPSVAK